MSKQDAQCWAMLHSPHPLRDAMHATAKRVTKSPIARMMTAFAGSSVDSNLAGIGP
jgi:hypothetical protein